MKIKANLVVFLILVFFAQIRAIASDLSGWNEIKKIIAWELQQDTLAIQDFEASYHGTLAMLRSGIANENSFYQKHKKLLEILHTKVFRRIDESSSLSILFTQSTYSSLSADLIFMAFAQDLMLPVQFFRGEKISALAIPYSDTEELAFIQITDDENRFAWRPETSYINDLVSAKTITKDVAKSLKRHEIFIHYVMKAKEISLYNLAAIYMYNVIIGKGTAQDWHNFFRFSVSAVKYNTDDLLWDILKKSINKYLNEFWKIPFNMQFMIEKLSVLEPWNVESEEIKYQTIYIALSNLSNNGRIELARELESATQQKLKYANNMNESIKNAQNEYLRVLIDHYSSFSLYSEVVLLLKELYRLNSTDYKYQNYYKER
ncbi:MAG: hypothetical protein HYV28_21245, partial [Ignavibacteriales bacterium]|nr:hypothetical protein [Ignavibacteriales bacterium]